MNKVTMKVKQWGWNALTFFGILGAIALGFVGAVTAGGVLIALAVVRVFAVSALQAAVIWLAWTYSGFGLLFVTLPVELQQLSFLNALCGVVILRVVLVVIRRAVSPKSSLVTELAKSAKQGKGVTA